MLFQYKCTQQMIFFPFLRYTDEHKELQGLSECSTWISKSTNSTHGQETLKLSHFLCIDA